MKIPVILALAALAADPGTCGPVAMYQEQGGAAGALAVECTGPSLRPFVCSLTYYLACNCPGAVAPTSIPQSTTNAVCATDASAALGVEMARWYPALSGSPFGGMMAVQVTGCMLAAGPVYPTALPSEADQQAVCAAACS